MNDVYINEQQRLLNAIWSDGESGTDLYGFSAQGISIYRRNLLANAERALRITFPTVFELLDGDISTFLVHKFLKSSPPLQGDWGQWGHDFSDFIATTEIGVDYPYLASCTALDWHVHCTLHGLDQTLDQASLQLLVNCEPEHVFITFNNNVKLLSTSYPVADIFDAHNHDEQAQRDIAFNRAKQALSSVLVEHTVMVYRPEFQPQVTKLTESEGRFTLSLMSGNSLAQSLDTVRHDSRFSFQTWLISAIEHNLIHYFKES
ncbi:putative DNA-binding domain-containing protein [Moritella sp. 36]|uniref:HvfC/BufC N-terminal domain-containing protein n=1 Tax=Moritella sp. 36 TaxID=2746233 RepID=UPI001BAB3CC0|nr:DNA-binding domain-containing protein [Moritella sp. 36]QUM89327.1 putative DNA-binding domain-containing protein [Moritella sp. 36]